MKIILNTLGLLFGIGGSLLIWKYGLPTDINRQGHCAILLEGTDESEVAKGKKYDRLSGFGMLSLAVGFALQLIASLLR